FIISAPCARPDIPASHWTQTSITYNVQRNKHILLKDSWWVILVGITPEGEIYAQLHQHVVPNIPLCLHSTNVGDDTYHMSWMHKFISKYGDQHFLTQIVPHRHYRLVLDTIGHKLQDFKCSKEVAKAVYDALLAHKAAYNAGILHCDISLVNIMIINGKEPYETGSMLIDWDLSKVINPQGKYSHASQYTHTGTWQFMVADLVQHSNVRHTFVHDLELAFWVLLWLMFSCMPNSWNTEDCSSFLNETMSPPVYCASSGRNKLFFMQSAHLLSDFSVTNNTILTNLLLTLKKTLSVQHQPCSE
ncbi:hypothetical protein V8E53_014027, partial [Lactarius tabidus]